MSYRPLISKIRVYNPNKQGSSSANRNYVQYIATRDGVSLENVNSINDLLNVTNQVEINEELYTGRQVTVIMLSILRDVREVMDCLAI